MQRDFSFVTFPSRPHPGAFPPAFLLSVFVCLLLLGVRHSAQAQSASVSYLRTFYSQSQDGDAPIGNLIEGADGCFYGTTAWGGQYSAGTIYKITPGGTETVLYSFPFYILGTSVPGVLTLGPDGSLYGTTNSGGANNMGFIFKITPGGSLTALYHFSAAYSTLVDGDPINTDGTQIYTPLTLGLDGNFYGTTLLGGANGTGTIFKVTPDGVFTLLHTFSATNYDSNLKLDLNTEGAQPKASLAQGSDGSLYGVCQYAGPNGYGTVYKITPDGTFSLLHAFTGSGSDGAFSEYTYSTNPSYDAGLAQAPDGLFYGTTLSGGANGWGTVYRMTAEGSITILHSFATPSSYGGNVYNADGVYPGKLTLASDGNFYGTTSGGGSYSEGTIYRITPKGAFTSLCTLGPDSGFPLAGLLEGTDGYLYGTTVGGVTTFGTFFRLNVQLNIQPSHVLFQDSVSGRLAFWQLDGPQVLSANPIATGQNSAWKAVGEADFNGDGWPDILFQHQKTGQLAVWFMNVALATNGQVIDLAPPPGWKVVGQADFNADGNSDILFQNQSSGQLAVWLMKGMAPTNGLRIALTPPSGWQVVGTGDFNGDGNPDLLFQNRSTGQLAVWFMNGVTPIRGAYMLPTQSPIWKAVAVKDLNRDGSSDIIFQNSSTGQVVYWLMKGTAALQGNAFYTTPPAGWKVVASH